MNQKPQSSIVLHANKEHAGVRFVVLLSLATAFIALLLGFNLWLSNLDTDIANYSLAISCVISLLLALGFGALVEYWLKRNWPSGQNVVLGKDGLAATLSGGREVTIGWSRRFNLLKWHFAVSGYARGGRERRVPKNYHCLAIQVQQDDQRFIVHAFLPQNKMTPLISEGNAVEIKPGDYAKGGAIRRWAGSTDRPKIPTSVLAGREGPYWIAERRRWAEGLEMEARDLETFLGIIEEKYARWDTANEE
jgi:hypothetical protein